MPSSLARTMPYLFESVSLFSLYSTCSGNDHCKVLYGLIDRQKVYRQIQGFLVKFVKEATAQPIRLERS